MDPGVRRDDRRGGAQRHDGRFRRWEALQPVQSSSPPLAPPASGRGISTYSTTREQRVAETPAFAGVTLSRQSPAITVAVSTMRLEKPHSLSYQLTTRTSLPSITAVSRLSTVDEAGVCTMSAETIGSAV